MSRRYVDNEPEFFFFFFFWRTSPEGNIKQGSGEERIEYDIAGTMEYVKQTYNNLLNEGSTRDGSYGVTSEYDDRVVLEWYLLCFC